MRCKFKIRPQRVETTTQRHNDTTHRFLRAEPLSSSDPTVKVPSVAVEAPLIVSSQRELIKNVRFSANKMNKKWRCFKRPLVCLSSSWSWSTTCLVAINSLVPSQPTWSDLCDGSTRCSTGWWRSCASARTWWKEPFCSRSSSRLLQCKSPWSGSILLLLLSFDWSYSVLYKLSVSQVS